MKRRFAVAAAMCALALDAAGAGGVSARPEAGPPNDFVLASFEYQNVEFFINTWGGPAGQNPKGVLKAAFLKGKVDCLAVHGREARVIADIPSQFFVITIVVRDNRPAAPDEVVFFRGIQGVSPEPCPSFDGTDGQAGTPVDGDINVHDA